MSIVPSLDTRVCSAQTHRFDSEASSLGRDIVVPTVSADLPYAQSRWCGAEGVDRVETLSDHKDMNFPPPMASMSPICGYANARPVDQNDVVQYVEYVPEIGKEVNFNAVLSKTKSLVK